MSKLWIAGERLPIAEATLQELCNRWKVRELSLFGSILRDDFGPGSDVDVLVSFFPDCGWDLWDLLDLKEELEKLLGRDVDLVEKEGLRNPYRRYNILSTRQILYAA